MQREGIGKEEEGGGQGSRESGRREEDMVAREGAVRQTERQGAGGDGGVGVGVILLCRPCYEYNDYGDIFRDGYQNTDPLFLNECQVPLDQPRRTQ